MKRKILSYILLFLLLLVFVNADVSEYRYYREIDTKGIREAVFIELDSSILDYSQSDGNDIFLTGNKYGIPYYIEYKKGEPEINIADISSSSTQENFRGNTYNASHMIDGSFSTFFQNDFLTDPSQTIIVMGFGEINKVESLVFTYVEEGVSSITVYALVDGQYVYVDTSKTSSVSLHSIKTNSLKIEVNHKGTVKISNVKVYGESFGKLLFQPDSDITRIYYGKANQEKVNYNVDHLQTSINTKTLQYSKQLVNELYKEKSEGGINDNCPKIDNPDQQDSDNDGIGNACDNCRFVKNLNQQDTDKDGIGDSCDNCFLISNPDQLDKDLDGIGWMCDDDDHDGVLNPNDNCLKGYNNDQQDIDRDGIGDVCEDDDNDGVLNYMDLCKGVADQSNADSDQDKIGNACDNCQMISNFNQLDDDKDNIGNVCEDKDEDKVFDSIDNCINLQNTDQIDWDKDGLGDSCDNCPEIKNIDQQDLDRDGLGDVCDKEESRVLENPVIIWSIMIIVAVIIIFVAFSLNAKKKTE